MKHVNEIRQAFLGVNSLLLGGISKPSTGQLHLFLWLASATLPAPPDSCPHSCVSSINWHQQHSLPAPTGHLHFFTINGNIPSWAPGNTKRLKVLVKVSILRWLLQSLLFLYSCLRDSGSSHSFTCLRVTLHCICPSANFHPLYLHFSVLALFIFMFLRSSATASLTEHTLACCYTWLISQLPVCCRVGDSTEAQQHGWFQIWIRLWFPRSSSDLLRSTYFLISICSHGIQMVIIPLIHASFCLFVF